MSRSPLASALAVLLALPAGAAKVSVVVETTLPASSAGQAGSAAVAAPLAAAPLLPTALIAAPAAAPLPAVQTLNQTAAHLLPHAESKSDGAPTLRALYDGGPAPSRFPTVRGEISWREAWRLANPASDANTVRAPVKFAAEREKEAAMYRHNLGYLFGLRPHSFHKAEALARDAERRRVLAERGARVRAAYALPEFTSLSPPAAALGRKLGSGGQGDAFASATRTGYAVKTFRGATGAQLQEMAAILNAVADQGQPVARVRLVSLAGGGYGLEMPEYSRETGWNSLAAYVRVRRGSPEARAAERQAEDALHAVGRETERVLGVNAADWKAGFGGAISDDHLENFAINPKTGRIACFDCLVKW